MKKGFTLYNDSLDVFDGLSDEQIGKLMRAIRDFNRGKEVVLDGMLKVVFIPFKNQFIRDGIGLSDLEISKINSENRKKRKFTKSNESNENNESVQISKSKSYSYSNVELGGAGGNLTLKSITAEFESAGQWHESMLRETFKSWDKETLKSHLKTFIGEITITEEYYKYKTIQEAKNHAYRWLKKQKPDKNGKQDVLQAAKDLARKGN